MVRAVGVLLGLGWSLLGCPRRTDARPDASTTIPFAAPSATQYGCSLEAPRYVATPEALESPWLSDGPNGPRVLGRASRSQRLFWRDARVPTGDAGDPTVEALVPSSLSLWPRAVGWTGRGFVGVADGRATFADARFLLPRPMRRLPLDRAVALPTASLGQETAIAAASREGAVLVGWIQPQHVGGQEGTPWVALVGAEGDLLMDPRPLSVPHLQADVLELQSMEVRWDFGRFVVQGQLSSDSSFWSWVLEPDGRDTWDGSGKVVCPLSGCVRMELTAATGGQYEGQSEAPPQVLRLAPIVGSAASVDTNIVVSDLQALAVSGDRLLVLHPPLTGIGCAVHVYDVGHRVIIHESSSPTLGCAPGSVLATPAGFSLLEVEGSTRSHGVAVRALSCGDDA